jgi:hypothetical protein
MKLFWKCSKSLKKCLLLSSPKVSVELSEVEEMQKRIEELETSIDQLAKEDSL